MGLKEYRIKKGLTQESVARKADISLRTYQNVEKNNNTMLITAKKISKVFGKSIEEVFYYDEKE